MGGSEGLRAPTFEEAVQHIVDPDYGLGLPWLWQLPNTHAFHVPAAIHDLRYDFLEPGENPFKWDTEFHVSCMSIARKEQSTILIVEADLFYGFARIRAATFEHGYQICSYRKSHSWKNCTYGQLTVFDLRCETCGLHKPLPVSKKVEELDDLIFF